jgi:hypothetical protein
MIGSQKVRLLRFTAENPAHDALDLVLEISTTLMSGTQRATNPRPHSAMLTTTSSQKNLLLLLAVAAHRHMKTRQMHRPAHLASVHRSSRRLLRYSHRMLHASHHRLSLAENNLCQAHRHHHL